MSSDRLSGAAAGWSAPISLYRALGEALSVFAPALLRARGWLRGSKAGALERRRAGERLAIASAPRPHGRLAWIAARAAADLEALTPVVDRLGAAGFHVLATTRDEGEAAPHLPPRALHQYAPLDAPRFCAAFLSFWRPDVAIFAGGERPPALVCEARRRGVPLAAVDARLSGRTAAVLARAPRFARAFFSGFEPCLAHAEPDAGRLRRAGAPDARWVGDPLYDVSPEPADAAALGRLGARIGARPAWCAFVGGLAEGELVIEAQREICAALPGAVLLLVPRRPALAQPLARRAGGRGLDAQIVGADDEGPAPDVLVAPGAGSGTALRAAPVAYLGGLGASAAPWIGLWGEPEGRGAQSPVGAAKLQCVIVHGPRVGAYAGAYDALDEAGAAACVADVGELAAEIVEALGDAATARARGRAAAQETERRSGASTQIMHALSPILAQVFLRPDVDDEEGA